MHSGDGNLHWYESAAGLVWEGSLARKKSFLSPIRRAIIMTRRSIPEMETYTGIKALLAWAGMGRAFGP